MKEYIINENIKNFLINLLATHKSLGLSWQESNELIAHLRNSKEYVKIEPLPANISAAETAKEQK